MAIKYVHVFRELTPTGNETPVEIDTLPSSDEEGSFVKYKRDNKAVKRKIEDELLDKEVEPKKRFLNGEKIPTEETPSGVFSDHSYCMPQQVYSPPPISDWETEVDINDKSKNVIAQPVINEQKIPEVSPKKSKQPLTVRDNNKIGNKDQSVVQKHRDNQVKTKFFNKRDMVQEATVLFEFLTKGIDVEDINYLKQSYDSLLSNDTVHYWMNETHWVSHPDILLILFIIIFNLAIIYIVFYSFIYIAYTRRSIVRIQSYTKQIKG